MKLALIIALSPALALAEPSSTDTTDRPVLHSELVAQHTHGGGGEHDKAAPAEPKATPGAQTKDAPSTGNPLSNAVAARTPEEEANRSGFQLMTQIDHSLGLGTFADARYYSLLAASLSIQGQYLFGIKGKRLAASATLGASYEYTMPDVETGRRLTMSNVRFGVSAPAVLKEKLTGVSLSPSLGITIPSSLESFNAGLITSISVGLGLSRSIKSFDLRASVSGSRGFFTNPMNAIRNPGTELRDSYGNLLFVCRPNEPACASLGMNTAWSLSAGGSVQYRLTGELMLYAGYTFAKSWGYAATETIDAATAKALDSNGNPVARASLGQRDRTTAFLGASYQINDHYSVDLGLQTVQAPLTATGQVRFPWFAFGALADNGTTASFSLAAAY